MINPFAQTLEEDFGIWWNMPKYKTRDIEARAYANNKIVKTNASNKDWPGPEKDVKYWLYLITPSVLVLCMVCLMQANAVQSLQNFLYTIIQEKSE